MNEHKQTFGYRPKYIILESGNGNRWEAEHKWIEHYRKLGVELCNKTAGGNGCETASEETRFLLSRIGKGKSKPEGFGLKLSNSIKGLPRGWTPEGEQRVRKTQFKKGRNLWASLNDSERDALVAKRNAKRSSASDEEKAMRAERCSILSKQRWSALSPEDRSALGKLVAQSRRENKTPEELSAIASRNAKAALKNPEARQRLSRQVKEWWASLTPEAKQEYIKRRSEKIKAAKLAKKNMQNEPH